MIVGQEPRPLERVKGTALFIHYTHNFSLSALCMLSLKRMLGGLRGDCFVSHVVYRGQTRARLTVWTGIVIAGRDEVDEIRK